MNDSDSAVERALAAYLGETARRADSLRAEASRSLVRAAHQAHGLGWSQRQIGRALGRSQPEVRRLLQSDPSEPVDQRRAKATPLLDVVLRDKRDAIVETAARHGAHNVRVFGSVVRGAEDPSSDVDLLVDLDADVSLFKLGALIVELEEILGRKVDVVPASGLRPAVAATVEAVPL